MYREFCVNGSTGLESIAFDRNPHAPLSYAVMRAVYLLSLTTWDSLSMGLFTVIKPVSLLILNHPAWSLRILYLDANRQGKTYSICRRLIVKYSTTNHFPQFPVDFGFSKTNWDASNNVALTRLSDCVRCLGRWRCTALCLSQLPGPLASPRSFWAG